MRGAEAVVVQVAGAVASARPSASSGKSITFHLLLKRIYGSSSEKFRSAAGHVFDNQADAESGCQLATAGRTAASKNRDKHGGADPTRPSVRKSFTILSEAEKAALAARRIWSELPPETSEQLDWRPSTLFVTVHVPQE